MTQLSYWQDTSPFVNGTTIRATPMNTKMGGISASLQAITAQINGFVVKLPPNFVGNTEIANQSYTDTLLYINKQGNMDLLPAAQLILNASHELTFITNSTNAMSVNGDSHNQFITCNYVMPESPTEAQSKVLVTVGRSIRTVNGDPVVATGSIIFFAASTEAELWLVPDTAQGVTILSSGTLRAYGQNSAIALISLNETVWLMVGDIYPSDVVL
ncbi:hypothetical protein L5M28_07485 [Shewanella sp. SW32]|uniref:hypothetical protein n=1 Tax=unclassified Shewanella TaxID=196818 RepID=UPI0021DA04E8|nr:MULTISPECIES: hypothetical protein [unclassified Shewanella]MCU7962420.1 hypothetical protein [Shewanella sp. SW32]MCU7969238.1 hypothetical protein [Shewanella sp. SW29]